MILPTIDPVALSLGPLQIRWYGLMYLLAFFIGWVLGRWRCRQSAGRWPVQEFDDLLFALVLGVVLGGRLGYVLFYQWALLPHDPLMPLRLWEGGMSFHGGLIGVIVAMMVHARRQGRSFFDVADFVAPLVPPGLFFGRIGNFINGELWGRVTDVSWGVVFPHGGSLPRHPSQLYEALLEGLVLFVILWMISARPRPAGTLSGLFLLGYGSFRFIVEFVREPDAHLGFVALNWMTMGQVLCVPMILGGSLLWLWARRQPR